MAGNTGLQVRRKRNERIFLFDMNGKCIGSISALNGVSVLGIKLNQDIKMRREEILTPNERKEACQF